MSGRGRPRTPDILTPREWEVLDLLRGGLSNREIADRLQISLAGAKFHVSEIITKLGVSTREEAAAWRPQRRWAFSPLALLSGHGAPLSTAVKLGLGAVLLLGVTGASVFAVSAGGRVSPRELLASSPKPTPTPELPCPTTSAGEEAICYAFIKDQLASWAEAFSRLPFAVSEPHYIPPGYRQEALVYVYTDAPPERAFRSQTLFAKYVGPDGHELLVNQGYGVGSAYAFNVAPENYRGTVTIRGTVLYWVNGYPLWETRDGAGHPTDKWDESTVGNLTVYWEATRTGPLAWEIAPDGKVTYHRSREPRGYLVFASSLPLEELLKVAESMLTE